MSLEIEIGDGPGPELDNFLLNPPLYIPFIEKFGKKNCSGHGGGQ